jgi:hypothetical protein
MQSKDVMMNNMITAFQTYIQAISGYNPKTDNEHTYRTPLENFLNVICADINKDIIPRQEVKDGQEPWHRRAA